MKKFLIGFLAILLFGQITMAQPVSDNAVIPMAITVNSILRLNVVDGGNIEFVFNTLNDIAAGLSGARYSTRVTVASSSNWAMSAMATTDNFYDDAGNTVALDNVCFNLTANGTNTIGVPATNDIAYYPNGGAAAANTVFSDLTDNDGGVELLNVGTGNAGDPLLNDFTFNWECGTANCGLGAGSITGTASGRYSTSILLSLRGL